MTIPLWVRPSGATLLGQAVASYVGQSLPVLAPLITVSAGVAPAAMAHVSALVISLSGSWRLAFALAAAQLALEAALLALRSRAMETRRCACC